VELLRFTESLHYRGNPPSAWMPRATILTGSPGQQRYNDTTTVFGASLSHPALRSRQQMLYGNLVFDANCAVPPSTPRCRMSGSVPTVRRSTRRQARLGRHEGARCYDLRKFGDGDALGRADRLHLGQPRTQTLFAPWRLDPVLPVPRLGETWQNLSMEGATIGLMGLLTAQ
jgi:hypothetical protein